MEALKILDDAEKLVMKYDEDADVLYLSAGSPVPALGIDIGDGVILRYDQPHKEVVGLTIVGLRAKLLKSLSEAPTSND